MHLSKTSLYYFVDAFYLSQPSGKQQNGENVIPFQIIVVGDNFIDTHARREQFQDTFYWIAHSPDAGFAVADILIDRDPLQQLIIITLKLQIIANCEGGRCPPYCLLYHEYPNDDGHGRDDDGHGRGDDDGGDHFLLLLIAD